MNPLSFGTGSALLGGNAGSQIQAAMQNQALGQAPATSAVSPAAPNFQPMPQGAQGPSPMPAQAPSSAQMPSSETTGGNPMDFENQLILKALTEQMKNNAKIRQSQLSPLQLLGGQ